MGKPLGRFTVYRAGPVKTRQRTRWKVTARNGRKVGNGGEAYVNEADAIAGALVAAHVIAEANGYQLVKKGQFHGISRKAVLFDDKG
jgi:hypothetical protein